MFMWLWSSNYSKQWTAKTSQHKIYGCLFCKDSSNSCSWTVQNRPTCSSMSKNSAENYLITICDSKTVWNTKKKVVPGFRFARSFNLLPPILLEWVERTILKSRTRNSWNKISTSNNKDQKKYPSNKQKQLEIRTHFPEEQLEKNIKKLCTGNHWCQQK